MGKAAWIKSDYPHRQYKKERVVVMTEHDWAVSTDPKAMLNHLTNGWGAQPDGSVRHMPGCSSRAAAERKLRLFACACCRLLGTKSEMIDGYEANGAPDSLDGEEDSHTDYEWAKRWTERGQDKPTMAVRASLLRDIFSNPFRPFGQLHAWNYMRKNKQNVPLVCTVCGVPAKTDPGAPRNYNLPTCPYASWRTPLVRTMAKTIYDERRFEDLAILWDLLEQAGCDDERIREHCLGRKKCPYCDSDGKEVYRDGGKVACEMCDGAAWVVTQSVHARGCWVLDCILGKS